MKYIISLLFAFAISLNGSDFKIAANTMNVQDCEGGGISLFYKLKEDMLIETSYNILYIRGVKNNSSSGDETWNEFSTQRLGIRYYLRSYAQNEIKLFLSVGVEHIYEDKELSSDTTGLNTYGLLGLDFYVNNNVNITFAFGSGGKGATADQLQTSPNYAHGFNSVVGIEYTF